MTIPGFEERTGTRGPGAAFALASRQRRRVLTRGRCDRLAALYQLDDLVGLPGEVAVRPERIVPAAVGAENRTERLWRCGL